MSETKDATMEKIAKSASVTLSANGTTMTLKAHRRANGTAFTDMTTRDAEKKTVRGATVEYPTMDAAVASLEKSVVAAVKIGWNKSERAGLKQRKPDAFATMPAPPKALKAKAA